MAAPALTVIAWPALRLTGRRKDEAVTPLMIAGLALAFAGTLLIISKGRVEAVTGLHVNLGNLWSLLAAITFAWFSIRVRDWVRVIPPLPLMVITGWSGGAACDAAGLSRLDPVWRPLARLA